MNFGPRSACAAAAPADPLPALHADVLRVVWQEARFLRGDLHRMLRVRRCDTTLTGGGAHFGVAAPGVRHDTFFVGGTCVCRDYVVDLVLEAQSFLTTHQAHLRNPTGAVRVHLRKRGAPDWIRRARVTQGAQARPERLRRQALGLRLAEGLERALLEYVADEAGSPAPLESPRNLLDRLADRAAREFGGTGADQRAAVVAALPRVEEACRVGRRSVVDGVPTTWWERYVESPLGRRPRWSDESFDAAATDGAAPVDVRCPVAEAAGEGLVDTLAHGPGGVDAAVLRAVLVAAEANGSRTSIEDAVVRAVRGLARAEVIPRRVAERFAADPARVRAAALLVSELGAAARPTTPGACPGTRGPVDAKEGDVGRAVAA